MGEPEERYSDVLVNFDALVKSTPGAAKALRAGFDRAVAESVKDGKVDGLSLSLSDVTGGLPTSIAADARAFVRRTEAEIRYRGQDWASVALVGTLREYLTTLATPMERVPAQSFPGDPIDP